MHNTNSEAKAIERQQPACGFEFRGLHASVDEANVSRRYILFTLGIYDVVLCHIILDCIRVYLFCSILLGS